MEDVPSSDAHVVGLARVGEGIVVGQRDALLGEPGEVGWDMLVRLNEMDREKLTISSGLVEIGVLKPL